MTDLVIRYQQVVERSSGKKNRDNIRNYFPVPNEIFRLGLSGGEILVY